MILTMCALILLKWNSGANIFMKDEFDYVRTHFLELKLEREHFYEGGKN